MQLHQIVSKMTARNLPASNIAISTFPEILETLGITRIARTSGWQIRRPRKVDAVGLVLAFCSLAFGGEVCHLKLAMHLGVSKCLRISRQAIWKRVNEAFVTMLLDLLCQAMIRQMEMASCFATDPVFAHFDGVLIQDGTCIPMPQSLVEHYPGNANRSGRKAVAKLDVLLDIKRWNLRRLRLNPYNRSDQSEALEANADIEPGWLVIRDLGYYSIKAIGGIIEAGAFFLSRLKFGTTLYDPATLKPINLETLLKRKRKLDIAVLLGKPGILVRLIAEPVPPGIAKRRREKALRDRDKRIKHGANYMLRLGWTLLITNINPSVWTPQQACKAYQFRWQVETMFKSWKSHLKLAAQSTKADVESPHKAEAIILAQMLMVVTVLMPLTAAQIAHRNERKGKPVPSQIKIAMLIPLYVKATKEQVKWMLQNIQYCCAHESRNRKSAAEELFDAA